MTKNQEEHEGRAVSVGFVSLGCAKNLVDSQTMAGALIRDGIALAPSPEDADVVIVNTCAFIEDARREAGDAIREALELKRGGQCRAVVVAGCMPQRYRHELRGAFPGVDAFMGLDELDKVADLVRRLGGGETGIVSVSARASRVFEPAMQGVVFTGGTYAYLKIADGCNHCCSFCAIPAIRGRHRSRPIAGIVAEAEKLLEIGIRELNLISQDTIRYGRDLGETDGLADLLRALGGLGGKFWIRLLYGHPGGITDKLLGTMAEIPQVCRYLDIPIQHSHPEILRSMNRGNTVERLSGMTRWIRAALPGAALRTTCLVGFPGETEEHFRHLLDFVREAEFDHLGVFVYSPEDGTRAIGLPGRPSPEAAEERRERLLLAQKEIADRRAGRLIGAEDEVLLETEQEARSQAWTGRARRFAPEVDGSVFVSSSARDRRIGDFVKVRYTEAADYDMKAVEIS